MPNSCLKLLSIMSYSYLLGLVSIITSFPRLNFAKKIGYLSAMSVHYAFMKKFVAI